MEAAPEILKSGKSDEITLMMVVLKDLHKQYTRETFDRINDWYKISVNNWAHADTLGMMILPAFLKRQITKIGDFKEWLHATNKFQRRSVPVTLIKTLKTNIQVEELFNLTDCLMTDPDREVHQGMGWFLREAWKRKPIETELFLMKWKELSPRLIIQYATEKMSKEERLRFRKNKAERKS
jgi:3-methyladenine DNA glycosylase AlkD